MGSVISLHLTGLTTLRLFSHLSFCHCPRSFRRQFWPQLFSCVFVSPPTSVIRDYFHSSAILFHNPLPPFCFLLRRSTVSMFTETFISTLLQIIYRYIFYSFTFFLSSCGNCPVACKLYLLSLVNFSGLTHQSSVSTPKKDKYVPGCQLVSIDIWTKYFNLSSESFACRNSCSYNQHRSLDSTLPSPGVLHKHSLNENYHQIRIDCHTFLKSFEVSSIVSLHFSLIIFNKEKCCRPTFIISTNPFNNKKKKLKFLL